MEIVFLPEAANDLERLFHFLAGNGNATVARKAMRAIDEGIELLTTVPHAGQKMVEREAYRQLFIPFGRSAYVLRYRFDEHHDRLVVVRVWHSREDRT